MENKKQNPEGEKIYLSNVMVNKQLAIIKSLVNSRNYIIETDDIEENDIMILEGLTILKKLVKNMKNEYKIKNNLMKIETNKN